MRPIYYEESDKTSGSQSSGPQSDPLYLALDDIRDMIRGETERNAVQMLNANVSNHSLGPGPERSTK